MFFKPRRSSKPIYGKALLFIVGLFGCWVVSLFRFVGEMPKSVVDSSYKTDAIVVLTGGSQRLNEGLGLLEKGLAKKLFVSGVYKGTEVRSLLNLSSNRQFDLINQVAIGAAENTQENAIETSVWMFNEKLVSLRLVTAAYHMPRSLLEFKHAMPRILIIPNPVFPNHVKQEEWWFYPGTAMLLMSEYNKLLYAWIRHRFEFLCKAFFEIAEIK